MTQYVLGLRRAGWQTDHATSYPTAVKAIEAVEAWRGEGGTITVILRAGHPIDDRMLLRDVRIAQHISSHVRQSRPLPRKAARP